MNVGRIVHLARAVLGAEFVFPQVASGKEAYDVLFGLIGKNLDNLINVYVTYGSLGYPKQFLNLRYFEFAETATNDPTRLRDKAQDLMERPVQDEAKADVQGGSVAGAPVKWA
jgi:hypothetical protein